MSGHEQKQITFVGAGKDAASLLVGVGDSRIPYQSKGATWPFAQLLVSENFVRFRIRLLSVDKTALSSAVTISLGKLGYLCFRSSDKANDFSFTTFRIRTVINELRKRGYHLDESCERNLLLAKLSVLLQIAFAVVFVGAMIFITISRPGS